MGGKAVIPITFIILLRKNKENCIYSIPISSQRNWLRTSKGFYYSKKDLFSPVLMSEFYAWWCTRRPVYIQIQRGTPSSSNISPHHPFTEQIWDNTGMREGRKIIWQRTFFLSASFYNQTLSTYGPNNQTSDLKCGHKKVIDCQMWFGKPPQAKVRHSGRPSPHECLLWILY